ncbi:nitroreductase [Gordonia amarae]|uniref:Nitroreductase n=1 Tax=Gordonia amarae TaxID=36821 RepID=A0A857L3R1_9ACTN|nr:nitroreductase [Gordonia amarae]QHN19822.1 nitroreductase [Gordonia amarae]QHN24283.1 nitroreductase [Gordonia amarae]QHN33202.1 nitroreductase [Gordonia amarae]QHN41925.1 nitroreductase [Gordonia amarae]
MAVRVSYRAFTARPVPDDVIDSILRTAQLTPSWCNSQSWKLSITRGAGTERIRTALVAAATSDEPVITDMPFPREYRGVHRDRRRQSGLQLYDALGIDRGDVEGRLKQTLRNFALFDAPHVAIIHTDEALGPYGAVDCGAYLSSFLLAATAHGVGSIAQAALAMYPQVLRSELGLGEDRMIVCGVSFGYPDFDDASNSYRTTRAPLDEVVDWIDA